LAVGEAGQVDEETVRAVLERLGSPDEIVAAEMALVGPTGEGAYTTPQSDRGSRPVDMERRALLMLTIGSLVLPFVGPLLGLWFASAVPCWTLVQKRTATMIVVVLLAVPAVIVLPGLASGEITWVFTTVGFLLPLVPLAGIAAAAYLVASTSLVVTVARRA
ncbi:MAG TPA: hypothetical protein VJZ72_12155, partial [Candidatus Limnocylindrales bacterium]|nr:hypothetical protein [Candidatus Limnocylindrales bacterium]